MKKSNLFRGPRFGVEASENGTYRAALYDTVTGKIIKIADERESYGAAFQRAYEMS